MDNEKLNTIIKELIEHLKDGDWHSLYSLHNRFRLSPVEILNGIEFLDSLKILEREKNDIKLIVENINDEVLKKLSIKYREKFSISTKDLENMLLSEPIQKIDINMLYIPKMEILDKSLLVSKKTKKIK